MGLLFLMEHPATPVLRTAAKGLQVEQRQEEIVNIVPGLPSSIVDMFIVVHRRCIDPLSVQADEQPHRRGGGR